MYYIWPVKGFLANKSQCDLLVRKKNPDFLAGDFENISLGVFRCARRACRGNMLEYNDVSLRREVIEVEGSNLFILFFVLSINQSINQSTNQLINQSINQPINQSIDQSIN